jgi:hypothetical protein
VDGEEDAVGKDSDDQAVIYTSSGFQVTERFKLAKENQKWQIVEDDPTIAICWYVDRLHDVLVSAKADLIPDLPAPPEYLDTTSQR